VNEDRVGRVTRWLGWAVVGAMLLYGAVAAYVAFTGR
jgi:hypothetical protein